MTEDKQPILLALGRGHNGFYCPQSRFHLVGKLKPQAHWPADLPFTDDIKRGVLSGTLIDVNKVLTFDKVNYEFTADTPVNSGDRKKQQLIDAEEAAKKAVEEGRDPEDKEQGELLSESDIDESEKKDLLAFIKKNDLQLEGLNSRSNLDEVKAALKLHFGYTKAEEEKAE